MSDGDRILMDQRRRSWRMAKRVSAAVGNRELKTTELRAFQTFQSTAVMMVERVRGEASREIWQVPEFSERSQVRSNVPANIVEKPTGKGTSQQQMILILISAAILTQSRFHNTAVVEQGSRGQPVVMHQPEEVLTSQDGSVGPDAIRKAIDRSLLHMP